MRLWAIRGTNIKEITMKKSFILMDMLMILLIVLSACSSKQESYVSEDNAILSANAVVELNNTSFYKEDSVKTVSDNQKISFDIETIKDSENVKLDGYTLQKGETIQVEHESDGNDISILIFMENDNSQSAGTKISIGTEYEIPQDGDYYFSIQNYAGNGVSNNIKGIIQINYKIPKIVQDERIQFTDDEVYPNDSQGMFDDNSTVLEYFNKNSYIAENYQENVSDKQASLVFSNFSGSKVLYELNFSRATTVDFSISADVDGEYKIAFISENSDVVMTASAYGLPASRPIDIPKGKTAVVLIGEQAIGTCTITLSY